MDIQHLQTWIGRKEEREDTISTTTATRMAATLDHDQVFADGDPIPPLWHWAAFADAEDTSTLGRDGHPARGGFLPPIPPPRRMWASGNLTFHEPLSVGEPLRRVSTITDVTKKEGRTGPLTFVSTLHEIFRQERAGGQKLLSETQNLVYRDNPNFDTQTPKSVAPPENAILSREILPTPTMLFRYSALTFNGHRIHYDADYARDVEHYPGLVVHGPLIATLLLDIARQASNIEAALKTFAFRAISPIFHTAPFSVQADENGNAWAVTAEGGLAMTAKASFGDA